MCGIAGVVSAGKASNVDEALVRRMCNQIIHRGPDDEGLFVRDGAGLGMRRLSIIDLSGGHQPVFNEDNSAWIVFNGEIYNFLELRPELEQRGHRFRTKSDTEVIIHLYEEYGAECVQKLRGMFGLAIYDERKRKLLLARDRFGKKPLHYALVDGKLYFASEIKSILAVAPHLAELNHQGLLEYLYHGYVPDPITAYKQIHKLPPGHLLEFENGEIRVRQYWDLPRYATHAPTNEEECLEEMEHRLAEAVRLRLISDVPLGAFLSGGVDSSTVVALMARASAGPVKTFAIGFKQVDFNEAGYARRVAEHFKTEHHELILEPDVVGTVEKLTASLEEPFGDSSMLPTYYVSQLARQHVTVALSGDGGDEIFAGYDRYRIHAGRQMFEHVPDWARRFYRKAVYPALPANVKSRKFAYNVSLPWSERFIDGLTFIPAFEREVPLLSGDFRSVLQNCEDPQNVLRRYFGQAPANDPISQMLYVDAKTYMVADILTKVDRMSMLTSLEVRVPIMDHVFAEWATSLVPDWKLKDGQHQKYILRKLAERVGVPRDVLYRKKQGFSIPLVHWMRGELRDMLQILLEPRTLQRGYFDPAGVRKLMDDHLSGQRTQSERLWCLLMFELWHRNYLEKLSGAPPNPSIAEVAQSTQHANEPVVHAGAECSPVPGKLRVAVVAPSLRYVGGQAVQADLLLRHWQNDPDVDARLLHVDPPFPAGLKWAEQVPGLRTIVREPLYFAALWRGLKDVDIAHIFSASYWSFLLAPAPAWAFARLRGKKTIVNYRSGEARDHLRRFRSGKYVLSRVDKLVAPSGYLVDVFREFGLQAEVVPNIVDVNQFSYRERNPLRPHLVCTRGFSPYYCVDVVVRAFAEVQKVYPEARLDLVGGGPLEGEIRSLVAQLGLRDVRFLGVATRQAIGRHYDEADIFINASRLDNMPVSVLEAFASGTPVVTTAPESMSYLVDHNRTGLLSPVGDAGALAANVIRLLREPDLALRLARAGHEESQKYRWEAVRQQWIDVYERALGRDCKAKLEPLTVGG